MSEFLAVLIFFPPIGACTWWVLGRGWSLVMHGGAVPDDVRRWQRVGFWIILVAAYVIGVAVGIAQHKF